MKAILAVLRDRRRAQRGSVLSGVLIITAFVAIISGALATELSTNLLLSHNLMTRVDNQATVDSALELALSQLQSTPLDQPCPALAQATLNGRVANASYLACWPTVDNRSPQFAQVGGSSAAFSVDAAIGANSDFVAGDTNGNVFDYRFGSGVPRWTLSLGGSITATPLVYPKVGSPGQFLDGIPLSGPGCGGSTYCLDVLRDANSSAPPATWCAIPTAEPVATQPAASSGGSVVYFAHGATLEANDLSAGGSGCDPESTATISGGRPVVAGPLSFRCTGGCGGVVDFIYIVTSDGTSSRLIEYAYRSGSLQLVWTSGSLPADASGMAVQGANLPTSLAVTFLGGQVELFGIGTGGGGLDASRQLPAGISDAPYWCGQCGNLIGVGAQNGGLYLFDGSLNQVASYGTGSAIRTTPGADGAGTWYVGAADGYVHELQIQAGQLAQVDQYGQMGAAGTSVRIGACTTGICIYFGSVDGNVYLVPLDARDAVLSACISGASPPTCSGDNPRVWANIQVGASGSPQAVHVEGWSYYSP